MFRLTVLLSLLLLGCDSSATDNTGNPPVPGFALTVGPAAVSLAPGAATTTSLRATRTGGLVAGINYVVNGAPTGLTTGITTTAQTDSSLLTIAASATLAAGTYQLVVTGSAAGAVDRQVTIAVTVTSSGTGLAAVASIAAGEHTCALATNGAAYCWGFNGNGEIGNDTISLVNPTPIAVAGNLVFQSLSVSQVAGISCGLTLTGAAYCWGDNTSAALGDGTTTRRLHPVAVAGGLSFKSLSVGNAQVCAIAMNGSAWCWGTSANGSFGDGSTGVRLTPAPAATGLTFQSVVAGVDYACGLTTTGAAYCWGLGTVGQLGNGAFVSSTTPVAVAGGLTFRSLAAAAGTMCGLTTDSRVYCWGDNFYGTVGDGTIGSQQGSSRRLSPVPVIGGLTFESIAAGYETICAVTSAGAAYCWGYNFGAVGDGGSDHRSSPSAVAGGLVFRSVTSGAGYSCGVTVTNVGYCWGENGNGSLGDGSVTLRLQPSPVAWPALSIATHRAEH